MAAAHHLGDDTLAVILAGGNGTRLDPLTRHVCKPALPFGAGFSNIDFSLSNCVHSGISAIGVPTQYKPQALLDHLTALWGPGALGGNSAAIPWRAEERAPRHGYRGTADAVYRNLELIDELGRELVLILAGDHIYKMDYRPMLEQHRARGAAATIGCVEVPATDARHFGVVALGAHDRIEHFVEKPRTSAELPGQRRDSVLASMGIYVFDAEFLARVLRIDASTEASRHDFGADILPRLIRNTKVFAYPFRTVGGGATYWRDIGTLTAYWRAHMELLGPSPALRLDETAWPVLGAAAPRAVRTQSRTASGGTIEDSLVGEHCIVAGHVRHSVLSAGTEVGRNTEIANTVLLPGAVIGTNCRLSGVIVGSGCRVPDGTAIQPLRPGTDAALDFEPGVLSLDDADTPVRQYARAP